MQKQRNVNLTFIKREKDWRLKYDFQKRYSQGISQNDRPGDRLATGEEKHRLDVPAADVTVSTGQVHVLGTITFGDY